ncbi:MAG: VTT domain-containing protein, partial [Hydrogenophaga sp.]|nr:VTT domain-containing protein [Hydrogenophaga sp.]
MNLRKVLLLLLVLGGVAAFFVFDLGRFLSLDYLKQSQASFAELYAREPFQVVGAYFLIYVAATALSLPGATIITLAGGALFGLWWGTLIVSFASSIGATLAFLVSRYALRSSVEAKFGHRLAEINKGV